MNNAVENLNSNDRCTWHTKKMASLLKIIAATDNFYTLSTLQTWKLVDKRLAHIKYSAFGNSSWWSNIYQTSHEANNLFLLLCYHHRVLLHQPHRPRLIAACINSNMPIDVSGGVPATSKQQTVATKSAPRSGSPCQSTNIEETNMAVSYKHRSSMRGRFAQQWIRWAFY